MIYCRTKESVKMMSRHAAAISFKDKSLVHILDLFINFL